MKTELPDYTLWYDGSVEADPSLLADLIIQGVPIQSLAVTKITPEVIDLNRQTDIPVTTKTSLNPITIAWALPDEYKYLNVEEYLESLAAKIEKDDKQSKRESRLVEEIMLFKKHDLFEVVRCLVYVLDTFKKKNVVWGVGRGSSCSSYIFYLMGLHEVDPVKYDISIHDFIK